MIQDLNKGWLFVLMSSLATVLGCFIITLDVMYKKLFPTLFKAHPFDISNNSNFLIASLSLSSGCLIFTALYRLLPESGEYLAKVDGLKENDQKMSAVLLGSFLLGMLICGGINSFIHFIASESIVHCVHDDESHDHDEDHHHDHHDYHHHSHETPADRQTLKRGTSLSDLAFQTLGRKILSSNMIGKCRGFESVDSCKEAINDAVPPMVPTSLHYSEHPQSENAMFFDTENHRLVRNLSENSTIQQFHVDSPLIPHDKRGHEMHRGHGSVASRKSYSEEGDDHHHHITTPLSRLLSIGVQTIVAICAHKFPEGFIMYSTSQANPELGLSICLSMLIHNFVEGFTMALPIYISLNSRLKAIALAGVMGGCAQPLGALLGSIVFSRRSSVENGSNENLLFGCLISVTAGFLSIIGFQMFASAMGFGGQQKKVLIWTVVGISLISVSYVLLGE